MTKPEPPICTHPYIGTKQCEDGVMMVTVIDSITSKVVAALMPRQALFLASDLITGALRADGKVPG